MKSNRKSAPQSRWTWKDDYRLQVTQMDASELYAWNAHFSNLNSNVASERALEQSIIVSSEVARRESTLFQATFGEVA